MSYIKAPIEEGEARPSGGRSKYADPKERARHAALVRWGKDKPMTPQQRLESLRARRKARKAGRGKPKVDRAAQATQNRAAVGQALNEADNEFLSARGLDGLALAADGQEPDAAIADGLIKKGLAVRGEDGRFRLTSDGKAILRAAEKGDVNAVLDKISEANDKHIAKQEKDAKDKIAAGMDEAADAAREKKPKGGGGGGGGKKPKSDEEKRTEQQQKRDKLADETAAQVGLDQLGGLRKAAEGDDASEAETDDLVEKGLVAWDGNAFVATDQGRRALTALERGNVRQYRAALQDAAQRMRRESERQGRDDGRAKRRDAPEERNAPPPTDEVDQDYAAAVERRSRSHGERDTRRLAAQGARGKMRRRGYATKHGSHDQSTHGRRGGRGRASSAAYSAARAGGASVQEARAAARDVSQVYAANQRLANIEKQLQGQVSDKQRASLEAEKARLQQDIATRTARTPAAQTMQYGIDASPMAPTVRGRMNSEQREWDATMRTRAQDALAMRRKVDADARMTTDKAELQRLSERRHELDQILGGMREQGYVSREQIQDAITYKPKGKGKDTLDNLPQDLRKMTTAQQRALVDHYAQMPLAELRRRQDLTRQQQQTAYQEYQRSGFSERNDRGMSNLNIMSEALMHAIHQQTFGSGDTPRRRARKSTELDMADYDTLLDTLEATADDLADELDTEVKAGRRNSGADQDRLDRAYDAVCDLCDLLEELGAGGEMEGMEEDAESEERVEKKSLDEFAMGDAIKLLGDGRVGGLAVRFGSEDEHDLSHMRDYFTVKTDFWLDKFGWPRPMLYHHALDEDTRDDPVIGQWTKATITDEGVWLEGQLSRSYRYHNAIKELIKRGALKLSSDSAPHLVIRERKPSGAHEVKRWPLITASTTTEPAEPRLGAVSFKALLAELGLEGIDDNSEADDDAAQSGDGRKALADERTRKLLLELDLLSLEATTP